MVLASFCGLLTLQVGVAILAAVFFTVAVVVCAVNVFDYHNHPLNSWPVSLVFVVIFVILMILAGIVMFMSAYNESRTLCLTSVAVIVVLCGYWVVLGCFSFANSPTDIRRVCVYNRCAESFWLINLNFRASHNETHDQNKTQTRYLNDIIKLSTNITTLKNVSENIQSYNEVPYQEKRFAREINDKKYILYKRDIESTITNNSNLTTNKLFNNNSNVINGSGGKQKYSKPIKILGIDLFEEELGEEGEKGKIKEDNKEKVEERNRYVFGIAMVGSILLFIINFLFFLFTIVIMWSYAQELRWADFFDDRPTYVVETD